MGTKYSVLLESHMLMSGHKKNKDDLIVEYIDSAQIDFTIITETWFQDNETDQGWVSTTTLNNLKFKISTENHKIGKGGGILLVMNGEYFIKKHQHAIWS